jgi:hypothetical protein
MSGYRHSCVTADARAAPIPDWDDEEAVTLLAGRGRIDAWDVDRLIRLAADLPAAEVALGDLPKVDEYSFDKLGRPTVRTVEEHFRRMSDMDPSDPVILEPGRRVMDGMHRVARALLEGRMAIRVMAWRCADRVIHPKGSGDLRSPV